MGVSTSSADIDTADPSQLPAGEGDPLIALEEVGKTYAGPVPVEALVSIDLEVADGEYIAIVGPSGSGKSTLLNVLGMLDRATDGRYVFKGTDTAGMSEAELTRLRGEEIGFVFQAFHLMPYRSATENVALALTYKGLARRERRMIARRHLDAVGLGHRVDALPPTLSGGERQRVAIARALAAEPSLLLCDEPTGNLDSTTAAGILRTIDELHQRGLTVVMITHDDDVAAHADRVVTIHDGRIVA